tara:strand:- start:445 stop:672 length:228 start_codon:yes stop_codon:yes gene_type:complete
MTGGFPGEQPWKLDAACRGERAEFFYEERYEALALSFCARCPVAEACGEAGEGEQYGVWNGESKGWPDDLVDLSP